MSATSRETAYAALATKLANIYGVVTVSRRLRHWTDVAPEDCPAIYLQVDGEVRQQQRGLDAKVTLNANVWIYLKTQDDQPAGPVINNLLDAVDSALAPPNAVSNVQELGGAVFHCWIEGDTQIFEGNLDDEAVAIVPVRMLIT